jgi:flavin-dependent thymidylate synthase
MNVELVDYTGKGRPDERWHAANVLIMTKRTRLEALPDSLDVVAELMSEEEKLEELSYMATTIPSSWEFVDVTFLVRGISRACAQQITRTRTGSYAMQSLRVVDASQLGIVSPFDADSWLEEDMESVFSRAAKDARDQYAKLIKLGARPEQARAVLPLATECSLYCKYNLRNFVQLVRSRSSLRTQDEYASVITQMVLEVEAAWPWVDPFFVPAQESALQLIGEVVEEIGLVVGSGPGWKLAKAMDLLRD